MPLIGEGRLHLLYLFILKDNFETDLTEAVLAHILKMMLH
jgi:hypothetical protein